MKNLLLKLLNRKKEEKIENNDNNNPNNIIIIEMNQLFKDNNQYGELNNHTIHHIVFINKRKKD